MNVSLSDSRIAYKHKDIFGFEKSISELFMKKM